MKRRTLLTGSLVACSGVAVGATLLTRGRRPDLVTVTGSTMGTYYRVHIPPDTLAPGALRKVVEARLDGVELRMSTYLPDSELMRFNRRLQVGPWMGASEQTLVVIEHALEVSARTDGAFDPTIGPLVALWGFGPSGPVTTPPTDRELADTAPRVGYRRLLASVSQGSLHKTIPTLDVDLSGIAKGFAVDRIAAGLDAAGVDRYLIDVGRAL